MSFWQALKSTYGGATAFAIACPLLALVPAMVELIQHLVEVRIGFYDGIAAAKAAEHHPLRLGFGFLKVVALTVPTYWITRFLATRDPGFAARADGRAMRLFAGFLAFQLSLDALGLAFMPKTPGPMLALMLAGYVMAGLLCAWAAAATLGNAAIGPLVSIGVMAPRLAWTVPFLVAAMLPPMVAHYALGAAAIFGKAPLWPTLIADSLLVGWLDAVIVASHFYAAKRGVEKAGLSLTVPGTAPAGSRVATV